MSVIVREWELSAAMMGDDVIDPDLAVCACGTRGSTSEGGYTSSVRVGTDTEGAIRVTWLCSDRCQRESWARYTSSKDSQ